MNLKQLSQAVLWGLGLLFLLHVFVSPYIYSQLLDSSEIVKRFPLSNDQSLSLQNHPIQIMINPEGTSFQFGDYVLTPLATLQMKAQVLSTLRHYNTGFDKAINGGDYMDLSIFPIDLGLGWGPIMGDPSIFSHVKFVQYYRALSPRPIDNTISWNAVHGWYDNFHIIPGSYAVFSTLNSMKPGQVVTLSGYAIDMTKNNGSHWVDPLSNSAYFDGIAQNMGRCRIVLIEKATINYGNSVDTHQDSFIKKVKDFFDPWHY